MGISEEALNNALFGDNSALVQEIKHIYVTGFTSAVSLTNTSLITFLFYKLLLKEDKEASLKMIMSLLEISHEEIRTAIMTSIVGSSDDEPFLKDDMDKFTSEISKTFEDSFKDIKTGIQKSFEEAIVRLSKYDGENNGKDTINPEKAKD